MITFVHKGDFKNTERFFKNAEKFTVTDILKKYGNMGVDALAAATPKDSGKTAASWGFEVSSSGDEATITWTNSNINDGYNIAVLIQYGHGTGWGGYVLPNDYINPAMKSVFDDIADAAWKEVTSL